MPKSRKRPRAKQKQKVYTHQRERKQGSPKPERNSMTDYWGLISHSMEILKLKVERKHLKQLIAMYARNKDIMDHFIEMCKQQRMWLANKIDEHKQATSTKMKLFLGKDAEPYIIPEDFHLGTTDLKNGYVTIENKEICIDSKGDEYHELFTVIMAETSAKFPDDNIHIGTIIPHDEKLLERLECKTLLKNVDVLSTILSSRASWLEDKPDEDMGWYCASVSCLDRKEKINFKDL